VALGLVASTSYLHKALSSAPFRGHLGVRGENSDVVLSAQTSKRNQGAWGMADT